MLQVQSDSEVQNLRGQLSRKQNEITSLQTQLSASSSRAGEVEGAKDAVSAELQKSKETAKVTISKIGFTYSGFTYYKNHN